MIFNMVGGGSGTVVEKDVNFFDYDGTLLHSFDWDRIVSLTSLPATPVHKGLVCQGWNWTLDELQTSYHGQVSVGPLYITDNGATRLYVNMDTILTLQIRVSRLKVSETPTLNIRWGDGQTSVSQITSNAVKTIEHVYSSSGEYVIEITSDYEYSLYGSRSSSALSPSKSLIKAELGNNVSLAQCGLALCSKLETCTMPISIGTLKGTFYRCGRLKHIVLPSQIYINPDISTNSNGANLITNPFANCVKMEHISLPCYYTATNGYAKFGGCVSLKSIWIPDGTTTFDATLIDECYSLKKLRLPPSITALSFSSSADDLRGLAVFDVSLIPTRLGFSSAFDGVFNEEIEILVPYDLLESYRSYAGWILFRDNFVGV